MNIILQHYKRKARLSILKFTIVLMLIILTIVVYKGIAAYNYFTGPTNFYELYDGVGKFNDGMGFNSIRNQYIKLELNHLVSSYINSYTDSNGIERYYYITELYKDYYITLEIPKAEQSQYDKLYRQTRDNLVLKTVKTSTPVLFTGFMAKSGSSMIDKADHFLKESSVGKNGSEYQLSPYVLVSVVDNSSQKAEIWIFTIILGLLCVLLFTILFVHFLGKKIRAIKRYLKQLSDEDKNIIAKDFENAVRNKNILLGDKWCYDLDATELIKYTDIVWMYMDVYTHSTGKSQSIRLYDCNSIKQHTLCQDYNDTKLLEIMKVLSAKQPNMFKGLTNKNSELFKQDYNRMVSIATSKINTYK